MKFLVKERIIMEDIRNHIITLSGEPVAGKSTVKKMLVEIYEKMGYRVHTISTGEIFRKISKREYKKMHPEINEEDINIADIQTDETFAKKRAEIDGLIDEAIVQLGEEINSKKRPKDVYIIDSRLAWHNIPSSFAVRLTVDEKIAGRRVFEDKSRGNEDKYDTLSEAIEKTRSRKLGEISRYQQRYGVDLANPENYDLIIDTSFANMEELAQIIVNGEKCYEQGEFYPQMWTSPAHFLPVQEPRHLTCREAGQGTVEEISESIKSEGYDFKYYVLVDECDGLLYLQDGNHRAFATLSAGLSLIPYDVRKLQPGQTPINISDPRYISELYDWCDGIAFYGGQIGGIKQLKRFALKDIPSIEKVPVARNALGYEEPNGGER